MNDTTIADIIRAACRNAGLGHRDTEQVLHHVDLFPTDDDLSRATDDLVDHIVELATSLPHSRRAELLTRIEDL